MSNTSSPAQRLPKAMIWFALGALAFYLIGFVWKAERDEINHWPLIEAEIVSTALSRDMGIQGGASKHGFLLVEVSYRAADGKAYRAKRSYSGLYHSLRVQAQEDFANGNFLQVRIDPDNPSRFEPASITTWGMWILAFIAAMFFFINGMTVLNRRPDSADKDDGDA